jgi:hypothetical protein
MRTSRGLTATLCVGGVAVAALFGRSKMLHWGATAQELGEALPGDSLVPLPHLQSTRIP